MDPDKLLEEILELSKCLVLTPNAAYNTLDELQHKIKELDGWLMAGGLMPARYRKRKIQNIVPLEKRNIPDYFKAWTNDLIVDYVRKNTIPVSVAMERVNGDFNVSSIIRSANFNGLKEFYHFGSAGRHFNAKGCVGVKYYSLISYLDDFEKVKELRKTYKHFIAIENNVEGAVPYQNHVWEPDTLVFLGEEGRGLSKEVLDICDKAVYIERHKAGTVRSLNVACAATVIFNDIKLRLK